VRALGFIPMVERSTAMHPGSISSLVEGRPAMISPQTGTGEKLEDTKDVIRLYYCSDKKNPSRLWVTPICDGKQPSARGRKYWLPTASSWDLIGR
jgi:hypothetical protein